MFAPTTLDKDTPRAEIRTHTHAAHAAHTRACSTVYCVCACAIKSATNKLAKMPQKRIKQKRLPEETILLTAGGVGRE